MLLDDDLLTTTYYLLLASRTTRSRVWSGLPRRGAIRDHRQSSPKSIALKPHSAKARWPRKLSQLHWSWQQVAAITPSSRAGFVKWKPSTLRPTARSSALPHRWLLTTTHSPLAARCRSGARRVDTSARSQFTSCTPTAGIVGRRLRSTST